MQETPQEYRQRMLGYIEVRSAQVLGGNTRTAQTPTERLRLANLAQAARSTEVVDR